MPFSRPEKHALSNHYELNSKRISVSKKTVGEKETVGESEIYCSFFFHLFFHVLSQSLSLSVSLSLRLSISPSFRLSFSLCLCHCHCHCHCLPICLSVSLSMAMTMITRSVSPLYSQLWRALRSMVHGLGTNWACSFCEKWCCVPILRSMVHGPRPLPCLGDIARTMQREVLQVFPVQTSCRLERNCISVY